MTLHWIIQLQFSPAKCALCQNYVRRFVIYYRACFNQDGMDEYGYNVCPACRRKEPDEPRHQPG